MTDAIFRPLADRQELSARQYDVEAALNDALLDVALAYFDVQQARVCWPARRTRWRRPRSRPTRPGLARGGVAQEIEVDLCAKPELSDLQTQTAAARANWRIASARLTRVPCV